MSAPSSPPHPPAHKKQDDKDSRHPQAPERPSASHLQSESNLQYPVSASTQLHTAQYLQNQTLRKIQFIQIVVNIIMPQQGLVEQLICFRHRIA